MPLLVAAAAWPALLFAIGVYGVLARRNAVLVLMGVELMLNAVNLNFVAFDAQLRDVLHGGQTLRAVRHRDRRGRDRAGAGDRAAGVPHARAHRRRRPARAGRPRSDASTGRASTGSRGRAGERAAARGAARAVRDRAASRWSSGTAPTRPPRAIAVGGSALGLRAGRRARASRTSATPSPCRTCPRPAAPPGRPSSSRRTSTRSAPCSCCSPATVALLVQVYSLGYLARRPALPVLRRARRRVFTGAMADRRHRRRPLGAARRLGADGRLLLLPDRAPLGARRRPRRRGEGVPDHAHRRPRAAVRDHRARRALRHLPDQHDRARGRRGGLAARRAAGCRRCCWSVAVARQVGPGAVPHLAAGRDARPDADLRADPRGHHGRGRRVPGRADVPAVPRPPRRR